MSADFVHGVRRADGQRTVGRYVGTALRECRRAAELNLRHGPEDCVATSVRRAREALDGAAWLCEYAASEGE